MPVFRLTIEKEYQNEFWVNVYHIEAGDLVAATNAVTPYITAERAVHSTAIGFTKWRVDDNTPNTQNYFTGVINQVGQRTAASELLPLFVVARVDFTVLAQRPSRKYLRGVLNESDIGGMNISGSTVAFINTNYATPLGDSQTYVDESGNAIVNGITYPRTAMRQLRRGSKKKRTP